MTQFNLADELRRGGTGLLAQAVAELVKTAMFAEEPSMREFLAEMERRAAAVPAGNQAKAPTALDEMRALQEGPTWDGLPTGPHPGDSDRKIAEEFAVCNRLLCRDVCELERDLTESREALAKSEAEMKASDVGQRQLSAALGMMYEPEQGATWPASFEQMARAAQRLTEALARVEAERDELKRVAEELGDVIRCSSPLAWAATGDMEGAGEWEKMALSALDQAASEAEVTERAIVEGSTWRYKVHNGALATVKGVDERTVHMSWFDSGERKAWPIAAFREHFAWVSDPEATESATKEAK